ncbi:MAG: LysM peptidoglycan-binding domain-containing protein [Treponema sp.]|jgi:hypothetical protein|nr:LysM peptidoglycan-binding domain-containing protein [Treponema sp.]
MACLFIITLVGYGFGADIEEAYKDIYGKIIGDFSLYERYLPRSRLIQIQAIRQTLADNETYDINHILRASKRIIDECDALVLQHLADRMDTAAQKYEKIRNSNPQLQNQYMEFTRKKQESPELLITKAGMEETEAFIHTVDVLYAQANWRGAPLPAPGGDGSEGRYVVKPGDFLRKIAGTLYGDEMQWRLIYNANPGIPHPDLIYPGMEFRIPPQP